MMFSILQTMRESMKIDSYSREKLLNHQQIHFTRLVKHAYQKSFFYRKIIDDRKINIENPNLKDFPILNKKILKENFNDIVTDPKITLNDITLFCKNINNDGQLFLNKYLVTKSSGTSGDSPYIIQTPKEILRGVSPGYRGRKLSLGRKKIAYVGSVTDFSASKITMGLFGKSLLSKIFYDYKFIALDKSKTNWIDELNQFKPDILCGYGKALVFFAELKSENILTFDVQELGCGAELLLASEKKFVETAFKAPVYNQYASTEHIVMGMCSAGQSGFVLSEDRLIFELGESDTKITNLYNYTLPLIRYQSNDILIPVKDQSPQQWPHLVVSEYIGRSDEFFIENPLNQKSLHPYYMHQHFLNENLNNFVKSFQFQIKNQNTLIFFIELLDMNLTEFQKKNISLSIDKIFKNNNSQFEKIDVVFEKIQKMDRPNGKTSLFLN